METCPHAAEACTLHLPAHIGDYTDFYVGIHHATNVGKQFRPDNPPVVELQARSYRLSWPRFVNQCHRDAGAASEGPDETARCRKPGLRPSRRLDYELELGVWFGSGNAQGSRSASVRQQTGRWRLLPPRRLVCTRHPGLEYQPLGPFLSKNFASTISAWIVTPEALAPFRIPQPQRPESDPAPLPYLTDAGDQSEGARSRAGGSASHPAMKAKRMAPHRLALSHARHMYWTVAQMIAHRTSNGCTSPAISWSQERSPAPIRRAARILEMTLGGKDPVVLPPVRSGAFWRMVTRSS